MKRFGPFIIALSLTILLASIAMAQGLTSVHLSDAPDGSAMTQFPSGTAVVYAIFDYADMAGEPIKVRVYDNYGSIFFEQTQNYTGSGTESVAITTSEGYFPDGRYVTNFYRGEYVSRTILWDVGEPVARPIATPTAAPTAKPPVFADGNGGRIIFGDSFTLESGEELDGDLVVLGGSVVLERRSRVDGNVVAMGGSAKVAGEVEGDLVTFGGNVVLQPTAVVDGDLVTIGGNVQREEGAIVRGNEIEGSEFEGLSRFWTFLTRLSFEVSTEISEDGSGVNRVIVAVDSFLYTPSMFDEMRSEAIDEGATADDYSGGGRKGVIVTYPFQSLEELPAIFQASNDITPHLFQIKAKKAGSFLKRKYSTEVQVDTERLWEADVAGGGFDTSVLEMMDFRYSVTLPGEITDHNGTQVGDNRVTWDMNAASGDLYILTAESELGASIPVGPILGVCGAVVLVVVVGGVGLLARRGKARTAPTQRLFCPQCGAANEVGAKFCMKCGSALPK